MISSTRSYASFTSCIRQSTVETIFVGSLSIITVLTLGNFVLQPSVSEIIPFGNNGTAHSNCDCVVFRMDGIQDYWISAGQIAVMNQFIVKNQSLTLGILTSDIGEDTDLIDNVKRGVDSGHFELAIHGANDTDHTKLSEEQQRNSLNESNTKLFALFDNASEIFIPPFDAFNNDTINAMREVNMRILSGNTSSFSELQLGDSNENESLALSSDPMQSRSILYIPSTISFKDYIDDQYVRNSIEDIFNNVTQSIGAYGYAVIVLDPQDFMILDANGDATDTLDINEVTDLSNLIDLMVSDTIHIGSFAEITAGIGSQDNNIPAPFFG